MHFWRSNVSTNQNAANQNAGSGKVTTRNAFTLLEVVVGLTLMASVLVGSMLSFSAHQIQLRHAEDTIVAVAVADQLLTQFTGSRDGIPAASAGRIAAHPNWLWQTRTVGTAAPATLPLRVIRLEIIDVAANGTRRVLSSVEVVEPMS
jgi:type II secretory pathway pseudopilin PulG